MRKRGQVTIFIIIGLLIVLSGLLAFYARQTYLEKVVEPQIYRGLSAIERLDSLNNYIKSCIDFVAPESIKEFASKRLYILSEPENRLYFDGFELPVLCTLTSEGCLQHPLFKDAIEERLGFLITQNLLACIDLDRFERVGYELEYDPLTINVDINLGIKDTSIFVEYPITLKTAEQELSTSRFADKVDLPLGQLHKLAVDIVNTIAREGNFDKDEWMRNNAARFIIDVDKPYPDTIYTIRENDLNLKFAIKGIDTVGRSHILAPKQHGCCEADTICYENVPEEQCINLSYTEEPSCTCLTIEQPVVEGCCVQISRCSFTTQEVCQGEFHVNSDCSEFSCVNLHCGEHKHGESWCEYDGLDYVGSRHYLYSCFNGEILEEPCRDYREELCTQTTVDGLSKATCRINRWQDCHTCNNRECCEDTELRDCSWENKVCVPHVPPGFKFWDSGSPNTCGVANEEYTSPIKSQQRINNAALICLQQGDCGNYRNIAKRITYNGFKHSDGKEESSVYGPVTKEYSINLPLDTTNQAERATATATELTTSSTALDFTQFMHRLGSYETELFEPLDPTAIGRDHYAFCGLWTQHLQSDCSLCMEMVCSEYVCRSLGGNCIYHKNKGISTCDQPYARDKTPPVIQIDEEVLNEEYNATPSSIVEWYNGYTITPAIVPYKPLTVGIKTSEETLCKLTYLPTEEFDILPPFWFGDSSYSHNHNFTLRLPKVIAIPPGFYKYHNLTNVSGIINVPGFLPDPELELAALKILDDFQQQKYYLFVLCTDKSGNTNEDRFFISFSLEKEEDTEAPAIITTSPAKNEIIGGDPSTIPLKLYINEPAECRLDTTDKPYEQMTYILNCETREYFMSAVAGGSYECLGEVPFTETYYIRCKDNPIETKRYSLALQENTTLNVSINLFNKSNLTADSVFIEDISLLPATIFTPVNITFSFNINEDAECRFSNESVNFEVMEQSFACANNQCEGYLELINNKTDYYIACRRPGISITQNTNNESYVLNLIRSEGLSIISLKPEVEIHQTNTQLIVETSGDIQEDNIVCNYGIEGEFYAMEVVNNQFIKQLIDLEENTAYAFPIRCEDRYNNLAEGEIVFSVII